MDSTNLQSISIPNPNWRNTMTMQDRARFVRQLAQALKQLSPDTANESIVTAAKNFENSVYSQSINKNQYFLAHSRKFNQIRYQIQTQTPTNVTVPPSVGGGVDPNAVTIASSMAAQQTQSSLSPQVQMMHQQTQNMVNTQQVFMQSLTSQPSLTQNYQQSNIQDSIPSDTTTTSQQQLQRPAPMNQQPTAALPMTPQSYVGNTLLTPSQHQQQQQLQIFLARQKVLQQQQQQQQMNTTMVQNATMNTAVSNMNNISRPSMPAHSVNQVAASVQPNNIPQPTNPITQVNPTLAAQFKLQHEQLLQNQQRDRSLVRDPEKQVYLQRLHQHQIQQLQNQFARQMQQQSQQLLATLQQPQTNALTQNQPLMTSMHPPQPQANAFIQNRPVMTNIQQQPFASTKPLLQQTSPMISDQQRMQAINMVRQLDENVRINRVQGPALNGLTDQEKKAIWEIVMQIRPLYEKVSQLLPVFSALTLNFEATRRLILMKYLFEDQLNALPQNIYLMNAGRLRQLGEQFSGYFAWVRNVMNGNTIPTSQPQLTPGQQPGLQQQQQLSHQPQSQQQTPSVSHAETSTNTDTSSPSMRPSPLTKREPIDLTLPPSKKQRGTIDQKQQSLNAPNIPETAYYSQAENASSAIPDCARASTKTDTPSSTGSIPDTTQQQQQQQQNPVTTTMQSDLPPQTANQAAIDFGIPQAIVAILPTRALKCCWLLKQESLKKIPMSDEHKMQIRRMLEGFITQAKVQLGKEQGKEQQQQLGTLKMDQQQSDTIDLTTSPPPPPLAMLSITTTTTTNGTNSTNSNSNNNTLNWAMESGSSEKGTALESSVLLHGLQQQLKIDPTSSMSAPSATVNETAFTTVPISSSSSTTIDPSVNSTTILQPTVLTASPVSINNVRPNMTPDVKATLFSNDPLKDIPAFMTNSPPLTETSSKPLFMIDDFIIDDDNNNNTGMGTQVTGQSYNNYNNSAPSNDPPVLFSSSTSSSESPSSLVFAALKEGYKDETFCINELDSNRLTNSSILSKNTTSLNLDPTNSKASSLSSTSLSSSELNDDMAKNNWYQIGSDKDSLGITDSIPGLDFDSDAFIGYDSSNRLSHPPLF